MKSVSELIDAIQNAYSYDDVREELAELATVTGYGDVWDYENQETFCKIIRCMERQLHCDLVPADREELTVLLYEKQEFSADDEPRNILTVSGFDSAHRIGIDENTDQEYHPGDIMLYGVGGDILAILTFVR